MTVTSFLAKYVLAGSRFTVTVMTVVALGSKATPSGGTGVGSADDAKTAAPRSTTAVLTMTTSLPGAAMVMPVPAATMAPTRIRAPTNARTFLKVDIILPSALKLSPNSIGAGSALNRTRVRLPGKLSGFLQPGFSTGIYRARF